MAESVRYPVGLAVFVCVAILGVYLRRYLHRERTVCGDLCLLVRISP